MEIECCYCGEKKEDNEMVEFLQESSLGGVDKFEVMYACRGDCSLKVDLHHHLGLFRMSLKSCVNHLVKDHWLKTNDIERILNERCDECGETFYQQLKKVYRI